MILVPMISVAFLLVDSVHYVYASENTTSLFSFCSLCTCSTRSASPWGLPGIDVICDSFPRESVSSPWPLLPPRTRHLRISNSKLTEAPPVQVLNNTGLRTIALSYNLIEQISALEFTLLPSLVELDMSHNLIRELNLKGAHRLQRLDLSFNNLTSLPAHFLGSLNSLVYLDLSYNRLGEYLSSDAGFQSIGIGMTSMLRELRLESIGIKSINGTALTLARGLRVISLRNNPLKYAPKLPRSLEELDLSGTNLKVVHPREIGSLPLLNVLKMQDINSLTAVLPYAFFATPQLKELYFDGCASLANFSELAFGRGVLNGDVQPTLEILSFEGALLRRLNETLRPAFRALKTLSLAGNPWICDCGSLWLRDLHLNLSVRCYGPPALRSRNFAEFDDDEMPCSGSWFPRPHSIMTGLLVLMLLVLCALSAWLVLVWRGPSRRTTIALTGPHPQSPYAPVTIEPNDVHMR